MPATLFDEYPIESSVRPFKVQLLKWIGNKQKFAHEIISYFPKHINVYHEPFLGSGAVLGTLAPSAARASDCFVPLIEIWDTLKRDPELLVSWYTKRWHAYTDGDYVTEYARILSDYNAKPNGADLLFLCRSCYGGVVRFRQADGYMSTPCGIHKPVPPDSFKHRVQEWTNRTKNTRFAVLDFEEAMTAAKSGDVVYCDPPYTFSQAILYGAQGFSLDRLFRAIDCCKQRGVYVALSIDGTKKSGNMICDLPIPDGLFEREVSVNCGRSMLKRFQMGGQSLESEIVSDRLLLTY